MLISALLSIAGWIFEYIHARVCECVVWFLHSKPHWSRRLPPLSTCVSCDFLRVLSKQSGLQRAAYHHLRALYSPRQHLWPNIWVEISQISPEEKLAQMAAPNYVPGEMKLSRNWDSDAIDQFKIWLGRVWLVRVFISGLNDRSCYSGAFDQVY